MANVRWLARATPTRQVSEITVTGPVVVGEEWIVKINTKEVKFVATATTVANVTAGLVALLNDEDVPAEFAKMDWVDSNPTVTGTVKQDYAGWPVTIAVETDSAGGSISVSTVTEATGPSHVDNVNNWSGGALPSSSDNIYFGVAAAGPKFALDALDAVAPALVEVSDMADYDFGLPAINAAGGYTEYRDRYLKFDGATVFRYAGSGSIARFDFGSSVFSGDIRGTAGAATAGEEPTVNILGSHANNALEVSAAGVAVAGLPSETATIKTLVVSSAGAVTCGTGVTLNGSGATLVVDEGRCTTNSALATATVQSGTLYHEAGTVATLVIQQGATCYYKSSGTCTAVTVGGTLDCTDDRSAKTFTTLTAEKTGVVRGKKNITFTNAFNWDADVDTITFG